jgi:hypothetical protein
MKKVIIGLSSLIILAFVVLLFVNAGVSSKEEKKAATETCASGTPCPDSSPCTMSGEKETKKETSATTGCGEACPMHTN